jgi:hypothetical protein
MFTARTGSSYLQTAFSNHPNMICENEMQLEKIHSVPDFAQITHSGIKISLREADKNANPPMLICTRNPLRSYISYRLVKENQEVWSKKPYIQPVRIDIKAATRYVADVNKVLQPFLETQGQILILKYEDGMKVNYRKALKFLRVPYQPPNTTLIKQTTKPLCDLVTNYNELKKSRLWYLLPSD